MGMFDSVFGNCPFCGGEVILQSKAGSCILADYSIDSVPISIAEDLIEESETFNEICMHCSSKLKVVPREDFKKAIPCALVLVEDK